MFTEALENTLLDAITNDNVDYAKTVIELINKHPKASLFAVDDRDNSFLHHALQHGATGVFKLIYSQIKNSDQTHTLLSMQNQEGNTLLALAVIINDLECAELVFNHFPSQEITPIFLQTNKDGNTLLHLASCKDNCDLFAVLLDKIAEMDSDEIKTNAPSFFSKPTLVINNKIPQFINQANNEGNTPLHLAINAVISSEKIAALINDGANFSQKNQAGETPLQLMLTQPIQEPWAHMLLEVFPKLKHENKRALFDTCRTFLIADLTNETIKTLYFLLATNLSLLTLAQAHLEFNEAVPLRTGLTLEQLYLDPIPASYRKKVLAEEKKLNIVRRFSPKMELDLKKEALFVLFSNIETLLLEAQTQCRQLEEAKKVNSKQLKKLGGVFSIIAGVLFGVGFFLGLGLATYFWFTSKMNIGFLHFLSGMGIFFATMLVPPSVTGGVFGLIWCIYSLMNGTDASLNIPFSQLSELNTLSLDFPEITASLDQLLERIQVNKVNQEEAQLCLDKLGETKISLEYAKGSLHQDKVIVEIDEVELSNLEAVEEENYLLEYVQYGRMI